MLWLRKVGSLAAASPALDLRHKLVFFTELSASPGSRSPGNGRVVAVAMKTALDALQGKVVPQSVKLPLAVVSDPDFKDGENYYADQSDNFFVGNAFPTCGINFTAQEIMGQNKENQ